MAKEPLLIPKEIPPNTVVAAVTPSATCCKKGSCCYAVFISGNNDADGADLANAHGDTTPAVASLPLSASVAPATTGEATRAP